MMAGGAGLQPAKILMLVLATGGTLRAQTAPNKGADLNKGQDVLIAGTFVTSMTYAAALDRLAAYYDEQVGHNRSVAFPEIAPRRHFEVWHEMWAFFEPSGDRMQVTLKRPADANSARVCCVAVRARIRVGGGPAGASTRTSLVRSCSLIRCPRSAFCGVRSCGPM